MKRNAASWIPSESANAMGSMLRSAMPTLCVMGRDTTAMIETAGRSFLHEVVLAQHQATVLGDLDRHSDHDVWSRSLAVSGWGSLREVTQTV